MGVDRGETVTLDSREGEYSVRSVLHYHSSEVRYSLWLTQLFREIKRSSEEVAQCFRGRSPVDFESFANLREGLLVAVQPRGARGDVLEPQTDLTR